MKQVIVLRKDIKLHTDELIRLVAHASVKGAELTDKFKPKYLQSWFKAGQKKITARVEDYHRLLDLKKDCDRLSIINEMIVPPNNMKLAEQISENPIILVVGPEHDNKIDKATGSLKLF